MGDIDEGLGPLAYRFAIEIGDTELSDDVMDLVTGGGDATTGIESGDDTAEGASFGSGGEGDNRFAPFGASGAAHEIDLATDTAEKARAHRIGGDLTGEIDLEGGVNGDHLFILGDIERVIDIIGGMEFDEGVIIDEIVQFLGAKKEASHNFAGVECFLTAGNDTRFDEVDNAIGEEFGMNADMFVIGEGLEDGIGDRADTHLEGGAIGDDFGDELADFEMGGGSAAEGGFGEGGVGFDDVVDLANVDEAIAESARHVGVDFGDDEISGLGGRFGGADFDTEATETMLIGGGDGDERDIEGDNFVTEETGDFGEEDGGEIGAPFLDCLADVGADEKCIVAEGVAVVRGDVGGADEGEDVEEFDVFEVGGASDEAIDEAGGGASAPADVDRLVGFDAGDGVDIISHFLAVNFFPIHKISLYSDCGQGVKGWPRAAARRG